MQKARRRGSARSRLRKVAVAGGLTIVVLMASFLWLPAIASVSAEALHYSVTRELGGGLVFEGYDCRPLSGRLWTCEVEDPAGSGSAVYRVIREGRRCWTARRESGSTGQPLPRAAEGCVKWRDQLGVP